MVFKRRRPNSEEESSYQSFVRGNGAARADCSHSPTPIRRRDTYHFLEGSTECGLRAIADFGRNGRNVGVTTVQKSRGNLHPPFGEVLHRRHADEIAEALKHRRQRNGVNGTRRLAASD